MHKNHSNARIHVFRFTMAEMLVVTWSTDFAVTHYLTKTERSSHPITLSTCGSIRTTVYLTMDLLSIGIASILFVEEFWKIITVQSRLQVRLGDILQTEIVSGESLSLPRKGFNFILVSWCSNKIARTTT